MPTSEEPYGGTGAVVGIARGFLRTIYCIPEYVSEQIPADYVVATVIAADWDITNRKSLTKLEIDTNLTDEEKVPIYNSVSSPQNPITWRQYQELTKKHGVRVPSVHTIWYYMFYFSRNKFMNCVYTSLLHTTPAIIVDTIAHLIGRKPSCMVLAISALPNSMNLLDHNGSRMTINVFTFVTREVEQSLKNIGTFQLIRDTYKKLHMYAGAINYFSAKQWMFRNENVRKMWGKLN
nr:fatty acyl-CoA reductase wat-like [Megalopta genalis]